MGKLSFSILAAGSLDATADLSRLLAAIPELADGARSMTVVLNWREAIGR